MEFIQEDLFQKVKVMEESHLTISEENALNKLIMDTIGQK